MAVDFKTNRIRTYAIVASGSQANAPAIWIQGSGSALNFTGASSLDLLSNVGNDTFLFVSGAIGKRGISSSKSTAAFGGDLISSGSITAEKGLSGSLTQLWDGTSYLVAGTNVTINSSSNGQVVISSTGGGGGSGDTYFSSTTVGSIFTTGSAAFVGSESIDSPLDKGLDVFFYVSGSSDSKGGSTPGVALFDGDVAVSGTISLNSSAGVSSITHASNGNLYLTNVNNTGEVIFSATNFAGLGRQLIRIKANPTTGNIFLSGSAHIGLNPLDSLYVNAKLASDIIPDGNRTRNLGSETFRFANIYTGDLHLRNERGNWTIVEEEDFLCVVNNTTGKRFKMMLEPLD